MVVYHTVIDRTPPLLLSCKSHAIAVVRILNQNGLVPLLLQYSLYHALSIYFVPAMHAVTLTIASSETDFDYSAPFFYESLPPIRNI